jgi:alpha-beta hydrolase superfamily lysophospholipase
MDLRLNRVRKRLTLPIFLQMAGLDRIVNNEKIQRFVAKAPASSKTIANYPNAHHTLEFEQGPVTERYALDLAGWIKGLS